METETQEDIVKYISMTYKDTSYKSNLARLHLRKSHLIFPLTYS